MTGAARVESRSFPNPDALAWHVAEWLCARAAQVDRDFAVCLSGGSTPRRLYETLARPEMVRGFPWQRVHWFWGDERFVPPDHPDSNYRMVCEALLAHVPVPPSHVHPIPTVGMLPDEAAVAYEAELKRCYGAVALSPERPLFDVTLLGIGEDGHTASLFPGTAALEEKRCWVAAVVGPHKQPRITLTYPALDSSRAVAFLATGEDKREMVTRAQAGDLALPAARVRPLGELVWFTDEAATPKRGR